MFGLLMPLVSKVLPWKELIVVGLVAAVMGGGWLYIGKLEAQRDTALAQKQMAEDSVKRLTQINADNVKAFTQFRASMEHALAVAKEAADYERQRNEDLNTFVEDLQNVQDTDACIKSEPVRRALEWLRNQPTPGTD